MKRPVYFWVGWVITIPIRLIVLLYFCLCLTIMGAILASIIPEMWEEAKGVFRP